MKKLKPKCLEEGEEGLITLFKYIYHDLLFVNPKTRSVILLEIFDGDCSKRKVISSVLLNVFEVPSVSFVDGTLNTLSITGFASGIVLDIGGSETRIVVISEGVAVSSKCKYFSKFNPYEYF